jgi:hypothetical protein
MPEQITENKLYPNRITEMVDLSEVPTLSESQVEQLIEFDADLLAGNLDNFHPEFSLQEIETTDELKYSSYNFFTEYLQSSEGQVELEKLMRLVGGEFIPGSDVSQALNQFKDLTKSKMEKVDGLTKQMKAISENSRSFVSKRIAADLLKCVNPETGELDMQKVYRIKNPEKNIVVDKPKQAEAKIEQLRSLKAEYKKLKSSLKTESKINPNDNLLKAKVIWVGMHLSRLNTIIAGELQDDIDLEIGSYTPKDSHASRLDKFKFGAGRMRGNGVYSPISAELDKRMQDEFDADANIDEEMEGQLLNYLEYYPYLPDVKIDSRGIQSIFKSALEKVGLLSELSEKDYDPAQAKSPDTTGKWRVIIKKGSGGMSINSKTKIVSVPENYTSGKTLRKVYPIIKHELTHVFQYANAYNLGVPILQEIGFDRRVNNSEGGAVTEEAIERSNLGETRRLNTYYYQGMQSKLRAGSVPTVAAYIASDMARTGADLGDLDMLNKSVDRALRLFNNTSSTEGSSYVTNSKDLNYAEQEMYVDQLGEDKTPIYMGGMNISHFQIMRKLGVISDEKIAKMYRMDEKTNRLIRQAALQYVQEQQEYI